MVGLLDPEGVDLVEISGGTYESASGSFGVRPGRARDVEGRLLRGLRNLPLFLREKLPGGQVWLFILAPLLGGALGALIYPLTRQGGEAVGHADAT